ncbi:MAG TPA: aspartyl protease family protein [Candidatus Saccharimonadales bacterium]|nr:aspartyl protease family protein [Candidatus Saccharimonadales bacterium]
MSTILCMASALVPIRLPAQPADRFWWNGQINGKPVRLVLDTGCGGLALWRSAADRLGLKLSPVELDSNNLVAPWVTGEFKLELPHWGRRWGFPVTAYWQAGAVVCEAPVFLGDTDGLVGWSMISGRITRFDAMDGKFKFLGKVPKEVKDWSKFTIRTNAGVLVLQLPGGEGAHGGLFVDTGGLGEEEISLSVPLWDQWMAAHPNERRGIGANFQIGRLIPYERTRASWFSIGGLTLTNVVLRRVEDHDWPWPSEDCAASIGFGVLKRFDFLVDGEHALAYLQPSKRWKPFMAGPTNLTLLHGRLGAVFGPWRNQTNCLTAYVMSASPAFESGIRDGDILLKVDRQDVKQWLDNPGKGWSSDGEQYGIQETYPSTNSPNGTVLELTLRRRDQVFQASVLQSEIGVIAPRITK